ncbi:MAG: hypothetical protein C0393_03390 [Anaerolinea sp.]|nr:hypothetical protein [Anaerolinea sp.]
MSAHPLGSIADYEKFIYSLPDTFPCIQISTLVVAHTGPMTAVVRGEIHFGLGLVLRALEVVNARRQQIERYGYELWKDGEELWWYDSWPHANMPELASTHPHHKHIPPDIKRHRVPAPGLSFDSPNLPILIQEIEQNFLSA